MAAPATPTDLAVVARARPYPYRAGQGPTALTAPAAVRLAWTPQAGTTYIRMQYRLAGANEWQDVDDLHPLFINVYGLFNTVLISGNQVVGGKIYGFTGAGQTYDLRIRAGNTDGESAWTAAIQFTTAPVPAGAPSNAVRLVDLLAPDAPTLSSNTVHGAALAWEDAQDHEASWELELRNLQTNTTQITSTAPFVTAANFVPRETGFFTFATPYTARVRAIGRGIPSGAILLGPWSDALSFTTAAPAIALIDLPTTVVFWRGAPSQTYVIRTNYPATNIEATDPLPAGLALATNGTLSGTPTAAVGFYVVEIQADDAAANQDLGDLTIEVRESFLSLVFARAGSDEYLDAHEFQARKLNRAIVGFDFAFDVAARALGPLGTEIAVTDAGRPEWLALDAVTYHGTPDEAGEWVLAITGTNPDAIEAAAALVIIAKWVVFLSADEANAIVSVPFTFTVQVAPGEAALTLTGAPPWLSLQGRTLSGTPTESGDVIVLLTASAKGEVETQALTIHVASVIGVGGQTDGPFSLEGWLGELLLESLHYRGACTVHDWFLAGGPPGVEIGSLDCPDSPYAGDKSTVAITGSPTQYGIFEATVTAQLCCQGIPYLVRVPLIFRIGGGLFFPWFHDDPFRRELQVLLRTREVRSRTFSEVVGEGLWLKRDDDAKVHVIFRDGPFEGDRYGREPQSAGFTTLRFVVRPQGDYDAAPYLDLGGQIDAEGSGIVTEVIAGRAVFRFDFKVKGDAIKTAFESANRSAGREPAAVILLCDAELTWVRDGVTQSSRTFACSIAQDIEA